MVTGCTAESLREILFTRRCSPRVRKFPRSVNFSVRRTVAELRGVKLSNFQILAYFPHTKPLKRTSQWPHGLHRRMITIFLCGSIEGWPKGAFRSRCFPATFDRGAGVWGAVTPKLAQIFAYGKWLYPYMQKCYYTTRQIWTRGVWKRPILRTDVLSHSDKVIFAPIPKSPRNPILGDLSTQSHGAHRKSHVNRKSPTKSLTQPPTLSGTGNE